VRKLPLTHLVSPMAGADVIEPWWSGTGGRERRQGHKRQS
jgi:hypothetical protein